MAKSLRGQCLIAAKHLRDPNFYKTVVLIVEHGTHGAMGLVINRPSSILVQNALSGHFDFLESSDLAYVGGPVEPSALLMLHNADDLAEGERPVAPGVFIGSSTEAFEQIVQRVAAHTAGLQFRIFLGCAGWAPGQLEGELERGDWYVAPACRSAVFHEDPYVIYECMLQKVAEAHQLLPASCPHPEWN